MITFSPSGEIQARQIEDVNGNHPFFVWDGDIQWSKGEPKESEWTVQHRHRPDGARLVVVGFWDARLRKITEEGRIGFAGPSFWPWQAPMAERAERLRMKALRLADELNRRLEAVRNPERANLPIPHEPCR